jgi:hypothetical protein
MRRFGIGIVVLALVAAGGSQALAREQAASRISVTAKSTPAGAATRLWTISGKVGSPAAACRANRRVKIEFTYEKPPFVKARTKTDASGSFDATVHLNASGEQPRKLKLTVPGSNGGRVSCAEVTKTLAVG